MTELRDLCLRHRVRVQGGARREAQPARTRQSPGRRGADRRDRIRAARRYPRTCPRRRDAAGGGLRRRDRRAQLRRDRPLGRVRRRARAHRAAQKFRAGQRRSDPSIGRRAHDDPRLPRRLDPQHAQNVAGRRVPGGRRHRKRAANCSTTPTCVVRPRS